MRQQVAFAFTIVSSFWRDHFHKTIPRLALFSLFALFATFFGRSPHAVGVRLIAGPLKCYHATMKAVLQNDLKSAMKAGETRRVMTVRGILAEITRVEKDVRREANEGEIVQVLKREHARRLEALEFAQKANRPDLIEQNQIEAAILEGYLPKAASADDVKAAIAEQLAAGVTQMGALMKALREQFGARLDGKSASELARAALAQK